MSDPAISRTKAAMTAAAKANGTAQTGAVAAKDQTDPSSEAQAARRGAGFVGLEGVLSFLGGLPVWRSLRTRRSVSMSRLNGLGSAAGRGGREAFGGFAGFLGFKDRLLVRSDARHTPILIRAWHQAAAAAGVIFLALGLGLGLGGRVGQSRRPANLVLLTDLARFLKKA